MYDNLYPVQTVPQSPGGAESEPKDGEEEVVYTAAITDKEIFYSSLEGPDWKDLPSFAYQISQGMVCTCACIAIIVYTEQLIYYY